MGATLATQYDNFPREFIKGAEVHNNTSRAAYYAMLDFAMKGKKVLDIGCGDGYDLAKITTLGAECYGIDASKAFVEQARENAPESTIEHGYMECLPYRDATFDVVLSKYALQTTDRLAQVLSEIDRVLRPGGILAYLTVHPLRQFLEKKKHPKDYFQQEIVQSTFFGGTITTREPTHTLDEYLSQEFLHAFEILHFREYADFPSSEQIEGDTYPCFFTLKARKKS